MEELIHRSIYPEKDNEFTSGRLFKTAGELLFSNPKDIKNDDELIAIKKRSLVCFHLFEKQLNKANLTAGTGLFSRVPDKLGLHDCLLGVKVYQFFRILKLWKDVDFRKEGLVLTTNYCEKLGNHHTVQSSLPRRSVPLLIHDFANKIGNGLTDEELNRINEYARNIDIEIKDKLRITSSTNGVKNNKQAALPDFCL